eukprot:TRINITY_DN75969_c0_g1_i1.p1 TRINITY_DN75969_c0_g1~~TRINITY_DN75969_c0_g1_i1.p1  ORF type:complete len:752 (-),score=66.90 TRINITY_DN75969_c0_g1_i1:320-2575(-)
MFLVIWIACISFGSAGPLAGPGSLTSYRGGPQRSNFGGFGIVQDPAKGFFIAGSSVPGVNGVYGRSMQVPSALGHHSFMLAYTHYESSWVLALVASKSASEGSEWLLIDPAFRDRFVQRGGQILPGAGPKWSHVAQGDERTVVTEAEKTISGNEDEFPWQIVGIMGEEMLQNLRAHFKFHEASVAKVLKGSSLPAPAHGSLEGSPIEGSWLYRVVDPSGVPLRYKPSENTTIVRTLAHGEYVHVDEKRSRWLRLAPGTKKNRPPLWAPTHDSSLVSRPRLLLVEDMSDIGSVDSPDSLTIEGIDTDRMGVAQIPSAAQIEPPVSDFTDIPRGGSGALPRSIAPHQAILRGALGKHIQIAALLAVRSNTTSQAKRGVDMLRQILGREISKQQTSRPHVESTTALRVRLTLVYALLRNRRNTEASEEVHAAVSAHASSAAAQFWLGRCELRKGNREKGLVAFEAAVKLGPSAGVDGDWGISGSMAYLNAARGINSMRRLAESAYAEEKYEQAQKAYGQAIALATTALREDRWGQAQLYSDRAVVSRRLRMFSDALADLDASLAIFPRYARALFRRGVVLLELGQPNDAINGFEQLLRVDRRWPQLCEWLARAHSQAKRAQRAHGAAAGTSDDELAEDYYILLGVTADFSLDELKQAFRKASLMYHPDKPGGSERAFQRVAAAYETLANKEKRKAYDAGRDLHSSLYEDIERKYFPDRYGFWPFGDPFEEKRRLRAMRQFRAHPGSFDEDAWEF